MHLKVITRLLSLKKIVKNNDENIKINRDEH